MKRWMTFTGLLALSLFALAGCGGGGGGGGGGAAAVPADGSVAVLSTDSWLTEEVVTDGSWVAWVARDRERIMTYDGLSSRDMTQDLSALAGKSIREAAYDGRYFVCKATDYSVPHGTDVFYFDAKSGGGLINASNTPNWFRTDPYLQAVKVGGGVILWTANDENGATQLYAYDIATESKIQLSNGGSLPENPASTANRIVAWSEDGDIFYRDLAAQAPTTVRVIRYNSSDDYGSAGPKMTIFDGRTLLVWEGYGSDSGSQDIFKFEIGADVVAMRVWDSSGSSDESPAVSGSMVAWKSDYNYPYNVLCLDLAGAPVPTILSSSNLRWDAPLFVNGGYAAWVDDSTGEVFYADLTAADVDASIRQASMNFFYDSSTDMTGRSFSLGSGRITYEVVNPTAANSDPPEFLLAYTISTGRTALVNDHSGYRRLRSLKDNGGVTMWVSTGAFTQIWVQDADASLAPRAVSPPSHRSHQVAIDNGVVAWSGKPGIIDIDNLREIYYADLKRSFAAVQVTSDPATGFAQPAVDGVNGFISFYGESGTAKFCVYRIGDAMNELLELDTYGYQSAIDGGIVTWLGGSSAVKYCDLSAFYADTSVPPVVENIGTASSCPQIDGGVIAWHSGVNIYCYDLEAAAASASYLPEQATSSATLSSLSWEGNNNISLADGVIAFVAIPAGSGTQVPTIFTYSLGDPMDSLANIAESGAAWATAWWGTRFLDLDRPRIDGGKLIWIAQTIMPEGDPYYSYRGPDYGREMFCFDMAAAATSPSYVAEQLTDNLVQDTKPDIRDGLIVWRQGGIEEGAGNQYVASMRK